MNKEPTIIDKMKEEYNTYGIHEHLSLLHKVLISSSGWMKHMEYMSQKCLTFVNL